jgi:hypothetical protein
MKYTYISNVNANMDDMDDYANITNANGAATKSSAGKFSILSAAWQRCQP